jgi:hypothetical protein
MKVKLDAWPAESTGGQGHKEYEGSLGVYDGQLKMVFMTDAPHRKRLFNITIRTDQLFNLAHLMKDVDPKGAASAFSLASIESGFEHLVEAMMTVWPEGAVKAFHKAIEAKLDAANKAKDAA